MECRRCEYMRRFARMSGGIECRCCHEKVEGLPEELFGDRGMGFICGADQAGEPKITKITPHPDWCPFQEESSQKGQYAAEWDEKQGKIALKFKEEGKDDIRW